MRKANFTQVYSTPECEEMVINVETSILGVSNGNPDPDVVDDSNNWR